MLQSSEIQKPGMWGAGVTSKMVLSWPLPWGQGAWGGGGGKRKQNKEKQVPPKWKTVAMAV